MAEETPGGESGQRTEFKVSGDDILKRVKEIIREGNARRIIIQNKDGESLMEIPLTVAVIGTVLAPLLAAIGALTALATEYTIVVVKK
jgi:hypothetical protein